MKKRDTKNREVSIARKVNSLLTCLALSYASFPGLSYAQEKESNLAGGIMSVLDATRQVVGGQQQMPQMSPAQIQAMQTFNKFKQNSANTIQADAMGMQRHYMFSNCRVPPDKVMRPSGLCKSPGMNPQFMKDSMTIAQDFVNLYDKYLRSQNTPNPIGEQCFVTTTKNLSDQAQDVLNKMDKQIFNLEAMIKADAEALALDKKKLKDVNQLLNGGRENLSQEMKNYSFSKAFSPQCNDAYADLNAQGKSGGFTAIKDQIERGDKDASKYRGRSLGNIQKQIKVDLDKVKARIKKNGIGAIQSKSFLTNVKFKGVFEKARQQMSTPFAEDVMKVNTLLKELGSSDQIPNPSDPSFDIKFNKVVSNVENKMEQKFLVECIKGNNGAAYSVGIDDIVGKFEHRIAENKGTRIDDFKRDAINGISTSTSIAMLDQAINSVNNDQIKVAVRTSDNKRVQKTISQYYSDIKKECYDVYTGKLEPANGNDSLNTYKSRLSEAKTQISNLKDSIANIAKTNSNSAGDGEFEKVVKDLINNCGGEVVSATSCTDKNIYQQGNPSFCLGKASFCSDMSKKCLAEVEGQVARLTKDQNAIADNINRVVAKHEESANKILRNMQLEIENMSLALKSSLFPDGIPLHVKQMEGFPKNTGIPLPDMTSINLEAKNVPPYREVLLKGGGDPKALLKQLKQNRNKIKKNFDTHVKAQVAFAKKIIDSNVDQWKKERDAWVTFKNDCADTIASINQGAQESYAKQMEQNSKLDSGRTAFCRKFQRLQTNPTPGCQELIGELYEDAAEISMILDDSVYSALGQYETLCTETQGESNDEEDQEENNLSYIGQICENTSGREAILSGLKEAILDNLSPELEEVKDEIAAVLEDPKKKINDVEGLSGTPTATKIKAFQKVRDTKIAEVKIDGKGDDSLEELYNSACSGKEKCNSSLSSWSKVKNYVKKRLDNGQLQNIGENNICDAFKNQKAIEITRSCLEADILTDKKVSEFKNCLKNEEEDYKSSFKLKKVDKNISLIAASTKKNAWAEVGERTGGTSCAHITGDRQFEMSSMLEHLDQDIPTGSNSMGVFR